MTNRSLWVGSGIAGVMALACYFLAVALPRPEAPLTRSTTLVVVSAWPILGIIYAYGLYSFVAAERESTANRLAVVFTVTALTTVLGMIVVQLAINAGISEIGLTSRQLRRCTGGCA